MSGRMLLRGFVLSCLVSLSCGIGSAAPWQSTGPFGGDARRIVNDPHDHQHLLLGTTDGWLFESQDMGAKWQRLARVGLRDDLVLDSIVLDPRDPTHIAIGAWVIGAPDGGVYVSHDAGRTWTDEPQMHGQSVRALAASKSNPDILVAGTLEGVFRSSDGGSTWIQISPKGSKEIHEIESIAIDPANPSVIYAGTWHLPWKTTDGGATWANIKQGIIDDSDVFSIIVDPVKPTTVYASACSGIYKSEDAGGMFKKVQGIPSTARRTRVLEQDPSHLDTVFAGTTEGLFRTTDAGQNWTRTTGPELIVNDVWISPDDSHRVLLSTDRGGVLSSTDGGSSFQPSNIGFSSRQITSIVRNHTHPEQMYVGVVNDKASGGVFESENGGSTWTQREDGLAGRDVFALGNAPDGTVIAGTAHGIFLLDRAANHWEKVETAPSTLPPEIATAAPAAAHARSPSRQRGRTRESAGKAHTPGSKVHSQTTEEHSRASASTARTHRELRAKEHTDESGFDGQVYAFALAGQTLLASTSVGLLTSSDSGHHWTWGRAHGSEDWRYLSASGQYAAAATRSALFLSNDGGSNWASVSLPEGMSHVSGIAVEPSGELWVGGEKGTFVSSTAASNSGAAPNWTIAKNLYTGPVADLFYDDYLKRLYVATTGSDSMIFTVQMPEKLVLYTRSGWQLRLVRPEGDQLVGVTPYDGVVLESKAAEPSGRPTDSTAAPAEPGSAPPQQTKPAAPAPVRPPAPPKPVSHTPPTAGRAQE